LGSTNLGDGTSSANAEMLLASVRGGLRQARAVCGGENLNIPLMGSGLSRVGVSSTILIDLILVAILEESKSLKVTQEIHVILPKELKKTVNLGRISSDWS